MKAKLYAQIRTLVEVEADFATKLFPRRPWELLWNATKILKVMQ
jgi:hypothetical protein